MRWIANSVRAVAAIAALLLIAPSSEAQVNKTKSAQATKLTAVAKTNPQATEKAHRLILQVNSNEPAMMNLALNMRATSSNITRISARKCRSRLSLLALAFICCAMTPRR